MEKDTRTYNFEQHVKNIRLGVGRGGWHYKNQHNMITHRVCKETGLVQYMYRIRKNRFGTTEKFNMFSISTNVRYDWQVVVGLIVGFVSLLVIWW